MPLPPHLRVAYQGAEYRVSGQVIRIGRRGQGIDGLLAALGMRQAGLITAANPRGRRLPAPLNARALARLRAALGGAAVLPGESGAGLWREPQLLVAAAERRLRVLARRFGQRAIVRLRRGERPALVALA